MTASKMTVAQLRAALVEKGLDGTGLKPALVARLESATSGSGGADAKGTSGETVSRLVNPDGQTPHGFDCVHVKSRSRGNVGGRRRAFVRLCGNLRHRANTTRHTPPTLFLPRRGHTTLTLSFPFHNRRDVQ